MRVPVLRRLSADEHGVVLLLVALFLPTLLVVVAVAVDLSHILVAKQKLNNAADAAALAVATHTNLTDDAANAMAGAFIQAHYPDPVTSFSVSNATTQVDISITAQVPTFLLQVLNTQSVQITVGAEALRPQGKIEVALVLDRTGSMAGSKIANLKLAADDLVNIVVWDNQTDDYYAKVAIVPYTSAVNVAGYADTVRGTIISGTCNVPGCTSFRFRNPFGQQLTYQISTCVSERVGINAFTDAAPTLGFVGTDYPSASNSCLSNTITPLSNDKTVLTNQIDALQAGGSTAGQIGIAWGWYLLSPNWGYLWPSASRPAPYSELTQLVAGSPLLRKYLILMTDGDFNTAYCQGVISQDSTSGSGSDSEHINCNATDGSSSAQSATLCTNVKAAGIVVYTIGFEIDNQGAQDLLANCATDAAHAYLAATGDELQQAFHDIATHIANLRLSR